MKISNLMQEKHITQQEVADLLNVSRSAIYKYQQGKAEPNIESLIKLADYFDVSLDYLCGRPRPYDIPSTATQEQKKAINLILQLDHDQTLLVLGSLATMLNIPYEEVRPARPF